MSDKALVGVADVSANDVGGVNGGLDSGASEGAGELGLEERREASVRKLAGLLGLEGLRRDEATPSTTERRQTTPLDDFPLTVSLATPNPAVALKVGELEAGMQTKVVSGEILELLGEVCELGRSHCESVRS